LFNQSIDLRIAVVSPGSVALLANVACFLVFLRVAGRTLWMGSRMVFIQFGAKEETLSVSDAAVMTHLGFFHQPSTGGDQTPAAAVHQPELSRRFSFFGRPRAESSLSSKSLFHAAGSVRQLQNDPSDATSSYGAMGSARPSVVRYESFAAGGGASRVSFFGGLLGDAEAEPPAPSSINSRPGFTADAAMPHSSVPADTGLLSMKMAAVVGGPSTAQWRASIMAHSNVTILTQEDLAS
jgi:hypothetical protein